MTTRYYGHKTFFQGRSKGVARAKEGSRHTLGILNEYGKSKPRVWLEYGWSMVKVWLESNILFPRWEQNIPTLGTKHSHVGNKTGLRLVIMLLLMMIVGVSGAWGQSVTDGIYYIANDNTGDNRPAGYVDYNINTPATNWYLVPADDPRKEHYADAWFNNQYCNDNNGTGDYTDDNYGNPEQPFLTTYMTNKDQAEVPENVTVRQNNSIWIVKATGDGYYNFIHLATGKYVVYEPPYKKATNRKSMHLLTTDSPGNNAKFEISGNNIRPISVTSGNRFFNVAGQNFNGYQANTTSSGDYFHNGMVGLYKDNNKNSIWHFEDATLAAPTITVDAVNGTFTITPNDLPPNCSIRYTTGDGTQDAPVPSTEDPSGFTGELYNASDILAITDFSNVKAVVVGYRMVLSNVANTMVRCATPTITYNDSSEEVTITSTEGSTIYYTTETGLTLPSDPDDSDTEYDAGDKPTFSVTTTIKAIAVKTNMVESLVATITLVPNPTINVTIPDGGIIYNGSEQEPTVTVKAGETVISADEYNVSYSNNKNVGTAAVTITDKEGGNYIVSGSTTFSIAKALLTITAEAKSKTYGDADPALTYTSEGLVGSDALTGALTRAEGEIVNTYAITQGTLTAGDNYNISYTGANLTITPKPLTITANSDTKEYDGRALTNSGYTNTALAYDDKIISVTVTGSQTDKGSSENVPSAAFIRNNNGEGTDVTACYDITYVNGTLSVTGRVITITAGNDTKVYDGTPLTNDSYTHDGTLFSGDVITSVTVTGSQTVAGTSDNVPSDAVIMNGETDVTENYAFTYVNGTLTVTQKALTITADDDTKVYDGTPLTKNTFTNTALATGDAIESVTVTGSQTIVGSSSNVPSAAVIKNGSNETVTASYNITYTDGTLEVTQASVTVTADDASKVYGDADPTSFTATVTGLVNNEPESLITITSVSRTEGENAGNYTITPAGDATQGNYAVSYVTGTFTIIPKVLGDGTRAAEGMIITMTDNGSGGYTVTVKDGATTLTEDTHYTLTTEDDVVTITGIGNYSGSARLVYANAAFATPDAEHVPSKDGYAAVYVSAMDVLAPSSVTVYVVKKVNATIGTVTVTEIGYIPEGVPVLLVADNNQTGFAASPVDFNETTPISDAVRNSNKLQIAPASGVTVAAKEAYVLYKGEFVLTLAGTISAGKIFLYNPNYTPAGGGAGVKILRFVVEDEDPDGINEELRMKNEEFATAKNWYTLDGRRIDNSKFKIQNSKLPKGIYITNGRKVIIK